MMTSHGQITPCPSWRSLEDHLKPIITAIKIGSIKGGRLLDDLSVRYGYTESMVTMLDDLERRNESL